MLTVLFFPRSFVVVLNSDRSENMIKNEYMKLSRDATHRRLKGEKEAMLDAALDGSGDKKARRLGSMAYHY